MMNVKYHLEDIDEVAKQVLEHISCKTLLLYGGMGAGKTTFVKAFAKVLGSTDTITSPTFAIVNTYDTANDLMHHFDLYRIDDESEALQFGIEDYLDSDHWIIIEWPEKIPNLLPEQVNCINIVINKDQSRTLKLTKKNNLTENICDKTAK